jgi:molybdopterin-guanine dinucleotide biosynthesis protein A
MELTAFVLAGGKSTRMGADKAFIELDGRTLLDRTLELAREITPLVRILGPKAKFATVAETVEDIFPDHGPLGGIHAALTATSTDFNLILAVDAPFIYPAFLRYLAAEAERTQALVTVPRVTTPSEGGNPQRRRSEYHPLCAVYRRQFRERAESALLAGHNKIAPLLDPGEIRVIGEAELSELFFPLSMFDNINTPEDLRRILQFHKMT